MISMDLSIIGTTGLSDKFRDGIVFGCDIAEEASIKSRLLAMSHFRIVTGVLPGN